MTRLTDEQIDDLADQLLAPTDDYDIIGSRAFARAIEAEAIRRQRDEIERLRALIDNPQTLDFLSSVQLEAVHQVERWGAAHDRSKSAENWFWLVGYLAGKALRASITGDREKALHHTISSAAALANWHAAISGDRSGAGIGSDEDIAPKEAARG
jgi:hypothetical protein